MSHFVGYHGGNKLVVIYCGNLRIEQHLAFAIGNGSGVLHRSRFKVGNGDQIELPEWVLDAEVVVVKVHDVLGSFERKLALIFLVGRGAGANGNAVGGAIDAFKVTNQERDEVSGKLLRSRKFQRVLVGLRPGRIGNESLVGNCRVAFIDHESDVERSFLIRLVEAREGAAGVGRLELRNRISTLRRLAQIKTAKLVVENAGKDDVQTHWTGGQSPWSDDGGLFPIWVHGNFRLLACAADFDAGRCEFDLGGIERNQRRRLKEADVNDLLASEGCILQIRSKAELVMLRNNSLRKALRFHGGATSEYHTRKDYV